MSSDPRGRGLRPAELIRAAGITRRYYVDGASKIDIANEYGVSRFKVARVLEEARRTGMVRIEISLPFEIDAELSGAVRDAYGLREAIVVSTADDESDYAGDSLHSHLGRVASEYLSEIVTEGDVLGLACSRTLNAMTHALSRMPRCTVVQLTGALSGVDVDANSVELVRRVASLSGGPAYPIYAPLVVSDPVTAEGLRHEPHVAEAMERYRDITKAVIAIGSWDPPVSSVRASITDAEGEALRERGVCAETCARLFDSEGRPIPSELDDRAIAIGTEQLRKVPEVVAVAGGRRKAQAIRALLTGGLVTSVITDAEVAQTLLAPPSPPDRERPGVS